MNKYAFITVITLLFCLGFANKARSQQADSLNVNSNDSLNQTDVVISRKDSSRTSMLLDFEQELRRKSPFQYPTELKPRRLATTLSIQGTLFAATFLGLNELWYKKYEKSAFHTFDDGAEWLQMDKIAHAMTASTISNICYYTYRWSGIKRKPAVFYAAAAGFTYMTTIEILDGYSAGWGFSVPDMMANIAGTSFFLTQQLLWQRMFIKMKLSYHQTEYALYRPEVLGDNTVQRFMKDYNGLTFWMSMGSAVFIKKTSKFPRWICLSFGYGSEGMLGGYTNPLVNEAGQPLPVYDRYRQFYLSFDVDFSIIHTKSKFVKMLLLAVNAIKIPFPALEYNSLGQFKFHYLYF